METRHVFGGGSWGAQQPDRKAFFGMGQQIQVVGGVQIPGQQIQPQQPPQPGQPPQKGQASCPV